MKCAILPGSGCFAHPAQLALAPCCIALYSVVALTDAETVDATLLIACKWASQRTHEQGWLY